MTDAPQPGVVLAGKFRVERVLGEGGMGVVVAATHLALDQLVAIKLMLPSALGGSDNMVRFEREARAAVRLKSEHVARVSDVGHLEDGAPYMVMEFLEGDDLDRILERDGQLGISEAVDYVLQACEAVAEAHALGIVHRDLKPKNLFLTRTVSGKPLIKVLDFGISKLAGAAEDMSLTSTQQILGSPNYMSPEQLRSTRDVDHRTDIWALGAILYELLTRTVPFLAQSVTQLTAMVVADPLRPITELRAEIPAELSKAISKCFEKRREDRFQSVNELAQAIAPFASKEGASKARDLLAATGNRSRPASNVPPPPVSLGDSAIVRVPGAGAQTEAAWDRTQLATGGARPPRRSSFLVAAAAGVAISVAVASMLLLRQKSEAPRPSDSHASVGALPPPTASSTAPTVSPAFELPTVREPVDPPLVSPTGGPDHPAPSGFAPPTPGRPVSVSAGKPDAGSLAKKPDAGAVPAPKPNDLPSVRD